MAGRYTYTLTCPSGKRRYSTAAQADIALDNIWRMRIRGTNRSDTSPCRAYYCDGCRGYHHTSQPLRGLDVEG